MRAVVVTLYFDRRSMPHLLIAHPGHELLLYGWMSRTKPRVHVLTDGSAHASAPRLRSTAELLRDLGARRGAIFGALSDREAYAMILEGNTALLLSLVAKLAAQLEAERPEMIAVDAVEGYNPVHDLCRIIAGAAIATAGIDTPLYEYAVVGDPRSMAAAIAVDLDDAEHAAKLQRARREAGVLADVDGLLLRYGASAYRREAFRRVDDWTLLEGDVPALYERTGEQRVASGRYARVIRRREHLLPLRDALCAEVEKRPCAF